MNDKMWDGRFNKASHELLELFNASINIDQRMYQEDILGSIAHVKMMVNVKMITINEGNLLIEGLNRIEKLISDGKISFSIKDEDIHMGIEKALFNEIGVVAKKLHTGRSRNDQVALDLKLYLRKEINNINSLLNKLLTTILNQAIINKDIIIPGYTHLQRAQPILVAQHYLAYFQMFKRDSLRLDDILNRMDECPLGAGALAGTTYPIDRDYVAKELGFSNIVANSIDAVSDRDYCIELASAIAIMGMHLSRFSEEIIIWSTSEFGFINIDDAFATGSSIMPQKKNPDVAELIRGKTSRLYGNLNTLLVMMKSLPLAYNKDMQEDKEAIFDSVDTINISLTIFEAMLQGISFNQDLILSKMDSGFLNATDLADYLAKKNLPFRDAHHVVGRLVSYCEKENITLDAVPLSVYQSYSPLIEDDVYDNISIHACIKNRISKGSTSYDSVNEQLQQAQAYLNNI